MSRGMTGAYDRYWHLRPEYKNPYAAPVRSQKRSNSPVRSKPLDHGQRTATRALGDVIPISLEPTHVSTPI